MGDIDQQARAARTISPIIITPPLVLKKRRYYESLSLSLSSDDVIEVQTPFIEGLGP